VHYIVLATNSDNQVAAFGMATGQPFHSEAEAAKAVQRLERRVGTWDFLVLPIRPVYQSIEVQS